jgi:hypothetical protein
MGVKRRACKVLIGIPEGERPLGRHRHRWEDNIKMELKEIRSKCMNWLTIGVKSVKVSHLEFKKM